MQQKTAREHSKPPRAPDALARALRALAGRLELGELFIGNQMFAKIPSEFLKIPTGMLKMPIEFLEIPIQR